MSLAHEILSTQIFGPFELELKLGSGGQADVYLARPRQGLLPAPRFVIKMCRHTDHKTRQGVDEMNFNPGELLRREADLQARAASDNTVKIFGSGIIDGKNYVAAEWIEGIDLQALSNAIRIGQRRMSPELAAYIGLAISKACSVIHNMKDDNGSNYRHGDISPSNILLGFDGSVKLTDFGLCSSATHKEEADQAALGKRYYLAPEQLGEENTIGTAADIFSIGSTIGELLLGRRVFNGSGEIAVLLAIRDGNKDSLDKLLDDSPVWLRRIIQKCLMLSPDERYQSGGELADELQLHLGDFDGSEQLREWVRWVKKDGLSNPPGSSQKLPAVSPTIPNIMIRYGFNHDEQETQYSDLVKKVIIGELPPNTEIRIGDEDYIKVTDHPLVQHYASIPPEARTARVYPPKLPDFCDSLEMTSLVDVLAKCRRNMSTGALILASGELRAEIYIKEGMLRHVSTNRPDDLLGNYLIRKEIITEDQLKKALGHLTPGGGGLADVLIRLKFAEPLALYRLLRNQGRDKVAQLCLLSEGSIQFYLDAQPDKIRFPLDIDISWAMLGGSLLLVQDRKLLPQETGRVIKGSTQWTSDELQKMPIILQSIIALARKRPLLSEVFEQLRAMLKAHSNTQTHNHELEAYLSIAIKLDMITISHAK